MPAIPITISVPVPLAWTVPGGLWIWLALIIAVGAALTVVTTMAAARLIIGRRHPHPPVQRPARTADRMELAA